MNGKRTNVMRIAFRMSLNSERIKRDFQKMSSDTRRMVDKILKQKIEPEDEPYIKKWAK